MKPNKSDRESNPTNLKKETIDILLENVDRELLLKLLDSLLIEQKAKPTLER